MLTSFTVFFFMFHTYYVIFSEILTLFLAQNSKAKVLTAKKNQLLECLGMVLIPILLLLIVFLQELFC